MELSRSKWLVTSLSPGAGEKMSRHVVTGGDVPGLLAHFAELQRKAKRYLNVRSGRIRLSTAPRLEHVNIVTWRGCADGRNVRAVLV
jgi:hypothetical protein